MLRKRVFFFVRFLQAQVIRRPKLSEVRAEVVKGLVSCGTELFMCETNVTAIDIRKPTMVWPVHTYIHTYMCVSYHNSGHSSSDFSCKSKLFRDISLSACYCASLDNFLFCSCLVTFPMYSSGYPSSSSPAATSIPHAQSSVHWWDSCVRWRESQSWNVLHRAAG